MLEAAVRGTHAEATRLHVPRPLVLGVTVLTSVGSTGTAAVTNRVLQLAHTALQAGCDGVIASAHEATRLRKRFGRRLYLVCPGIRLADGRTGDQRRVTTPGAAMAFGVDALVVGRPITTAHHPRAAAQQILNDMEASRC